MKRHVLLILILATFTEVYSQINKDTLFIKLDGKYLKKGYNYTENKNIFVFEDNDKKNDFTSLSIIDTLYNLKYKKIYCMNKIIKQSGSYYGKGKVRDWELAKYLNNFIIFIYNNNYFLKVEAIHEIE